MTTWNPTTGCDRVSPGCDHCYALTLAKRLKAMGQPKYQTDGDPRTSGPGFGVATHEGVLLEPLGWRKPRLVFVDSMADIAHAKVSRAFLVRVWATMAATPQHTYQILTKRPERLRALLSDQGCGCPRQHEPGRHFCSTVASEVFRLGGTDAPERTRTWPLPNVWLGTSIESDDYSRRAEVLRQVPAALRCVVSRYWPGSTSALPSASRPPQATDAG